MKESFINGLVVKKLKKFCKYIEWILIGGRIGIIIIIIIELLLRNGIYIYFLKVLFGGEGIRLD